MNRILPLLGVSFLMVLCAMPAGCGGTSFNYTGFWRGFRDVKALPGEDPTILRQLSKLDLEIKPTGRFELIESGFPYDGTFRESDGKMYLRVQNILGKPVESEPAYKKLGETELILEPTKEGKLRFTDPAGFNTASILMERIPKP